MTDAGGSRHDQPDHQADDRGFDQADAERFVEARESVLDRIRLACERVGRDPRSVRLVAVSKTVPPERIRAAVASGQSLLGENRVQELSEKVPSVPGASWHLIGPLQSNKARRAVELADVIETVDSLDIARRLDRIARGIGDMAGEGSIEPERRLRVLVQVNVDRDPGKYGFDPAALEACLPELLSLNALAVEGLMTIGRVAADPEHARSTFHSLAALASHLRSRQPGLGPELSMGMSDDYEIAVEEGATIVRVGRALFGERPPVA